MRRILVFCEGKTELTYIQLLNRLLRESDIFDLNFTIKNLEGVKTNNYFSIIKRFKGKDLKYFTDFYAWLDFDVFKRSKKSEAEIKTKIKSIKFNEKSVELLLNHMNAEDFIILHEETSKIKEWTKVCDTRNHFNDPMHSVTYLPLFERIMPGYKKGFLSELNRVKVETCINNINASNIPFYSDIGKILEEIIARIKSS